MKIIAQQFLGGLGPLHPANRVAAAPRAPLLPTTMMVGIFIGSKHYATLTLMDSASKLFCPARFEGESYLAYRHLKRSACEADCW